MFFHGQSHGTKAKTFIIEPKRIPVSNERPVATVPNALVPAAKSPVSTGEKATPPNVIPPNPSVPHNQRVVVSNAPARLPETPEMPAANGGAIQPIIAAFVYSKLYDTSSRSS